MIQPLFPAERQQYILEVLQREGTIRSVRLSELLHVSEMTIRRDLDALEQQGLLERTYGGAMLKQERVYRKFQFHTNAQENAHQKEKIAQAAATLIEPNDTIFVGEGTTTAPFTRYIDPFMPFTLFSNNLGLLSPDLDIVAEVIVLGGKYDPSTHSMVGSITLDLMRQFKANKVFIGCDGFSLSAGVTTDNLDLAFIARNMIRHTRGKVIIMFDGSKFGKIAETVVAPFKEIDTLITDREPPVAFAKELKASNVQVIVASELENLN